LVGVEAGGEELLRPNNFPKKDFTEPKTREKNPLDSITGGVDVIYGVGVAGDRVGPTVSLGCCLGWYDWDGAGEGEGEDVVDKSFFKVHVQSEFTEAIPAGRGLTAG